MYIFIKLAYQFQNPIYLEQKEEEKRALAMSYKSTNTKLEAEEDDADEEAEEANGETETDAETKAETEYEICSIFSSSSSCSSRVDGPSDGSCIQQPTAAATDCLLLQLERMAKKKLALAAIGKEKAEDAEKFTVGETANFKYRCYRSRSANQLSSMDREQSLELERKQVVKLELDRKLERERMRDRERAQERNRERMALQEQNQEELARERQWNEDNQLEMEHDYEYEQELELELELQLDQSDYPFLDLEHEPLQKQRTKRKQEHCGCIELREQLELRVREPVEDIEMEEQQAPHVASYPSKDQPEANNAQHKNKQENEELDEDVEVISRDGDESRPTTPYTYVNESQSDYRPGGYHPVSVGDSFQQRYFAISKLGWGHYSTVWLCYDTVRLCYCAIKLVKSAELYAESARHEIRLLRHISQLSWHPLRDRLVNLTDNFSTSGVNGTHQCLVFDVLGDNMLMLIQRSGYRGLPLYNVKQIAYQVLQGLYLLHDQGQLIHTDLKPENVLLVADDASLRTQATLESKKYLETHQQQLSQLDPKLSKTAKRRLRTKIKQSISFFQTHRKWLRERGISDLVQLAKHNLVTPKMAIDAVTNKLPYLAYDGPAILSSPDVCRLRLGGENSSAEQVGDTQTTTRRTRMRCSDMADNSSSGSGFDSPSLKPFKLLQDSTEKFLRYVQKCIEMEEQQKGETSSEYHYSHNKRIKSKKPAKKSTAKRQADLPSPVPNSRCLNMSLIERKDPALEPCKLRVAIADVGNACFIDQHITEDIQTREYRAVEVILGAGYDTSADLWSAACLFWELATGEYLFEPNKWRGDASQDEVHVAHIIETCGPIPRDMIARGEYSADIFDSNGELLNIKHLEAHPLHQVLIERYNWSPRDAHEFSDFLTPMLCTNPLRRITAFAAINHPWLLLHDMVDEDEQQDPSESNA